MALVGKHPTFGIEDVDRDSLRRIGPGQRQVHRSRIVEHHRIEAEKRAFAEAFTSEDAKEGIGADALDALH